MERVRVTIGIEHRPQAGQRSRKSTGENEVSITCLDRLGGRVRSSNSGSSGLDSYWTRYYGLKFRGVITPTYGMSLISFRAHLR